MKKKKMVDSLNKLSFVLCRLVVFPPRNTEAPGIENLFTRKEYPSEDTGGKKKIGFWYFPSGHNWKRR